MVWSFQENIGALGIPRYVHVHGALFLVISLWGCNFYFKQVIGSRDLDVVQSGPVSPYCGLRTILGSLGARDC